MIFNRRYQRILQIALPVQAGTLTYNGQAQSPVWQDFDRNKMTISGTTSSVNAGTFTATFTPKSGYCWEDGSREAKNVTWSIGKAAGSLNLSAASLSLNNITKTSAITVTRTGDGAITATSSNASVATVSISGTTVTVTGKDAGSVTITIKVAASTNYTTPADKTVSVSSSVIPPLSECAPARIQEVARSGQAPNVWGVGDKVPIKLSGTVGALTLNDAYYAFIIGFDHNSSVEGDNTIHFQFGKWSDGTDIAFRDAGYLRTYDTDSSARFVMNTTNANAGGWKDSYMRNTICSALLNVMPPAWRNIIAFCTKYSDNTGSGSNTASCVTSTSDKIWLLSEFEVFGTQKYAINAEQNYQVQYAYYRNGNSKVKNPHTKNDYCVWWLRSTRGHTKDAFCCVDAHGSAASLNSGYSYGFAPGFMVA